MGESERWAQRPPGQADHLRRRRRPGPAPGPGAGSDRAAARHRLPHQRRGAHRSGQRRVHHRPKRVPVIGTDTATPWAYRSPMYFPQTSVGDAATLRGLRRRSPSSSSRRARRSWPRSPASRRSSAPMPTGSSPRTAKASGSTVSTGRGRRWPSPTSPPNASAARNAGTTAFLVFLDGASHRSPGRRLCPTGVPPRLRHRLRAGGRPAQGRSQSRRHGGGHQRLPLVPVRTPRPPTSTSRP